MEKEKGGISVSTENIFPVIKRWLYSDKDIFLREVVSNACDAITKYKRLVSLGNIESDGSEPLVSVTVDKDTRTITISDNGIGMNADEVKKYINQIALSGALEFIDKYESKEGDSGGIIGHFGLGFYSVFMVSDSVEIITKSYDGSSAVHWTCSAEGQFAMEDGSREGRGTDIVLHIADDEVSYLDGEKIREVLEKYCSFMPYPVKLTCGDKKDEQINDVSPLWQKKPGDVTDEEYKEFYKKNFGDYEDPLMWVHINADYPLNFKGILYFPKRKNDFDSMEPKVSLYYNQVFVSDNIKEIVPEFLLNVRGILDCPELPLNVSRSYLQTNTYVSKVSQHIAKKVADRVNFCFNNDREGFEKLWKDLSVYVEYGCMRDDKFYDRVKDCIIFAVTDGSHVTVSEYLDGKDEGTLYYTTEDDAHSYYVSLYNAKGIKVLKLGKLIDTNFAQFLESKNNKLKFRRIDASLDAVGEKNDGDNDLAELFAEVSGKKKEDISFCDMGSEDAPALISIEEESRRMADMMKVYGLGGSPAVYEKLVVNSGSEAVKRLPVMDEETRKLAAKQIYMSALLLSRPLTKDELNEYVALNAKILTRI